MKFNYLFLLFSLTFFSQTVLSGGLFGPDVKIKDYLEIKIGSKEEEVKYRYENPTDEKSENNFKSLLYNYKSGISTSFVFKNNNLNAILCTNSNMNNGCSLTVFTGKWEKAYDKNLPKREERIYLDIGTKEVYVEDLLGSPNLSDINGNLKNVYYKDQGLFIQYNSGYVKVISVGKVKDLNFYVSQSNMMKDLVDQIRSNEALLKLSQSLEKSLAKIKKRSEFEINSSNKLSKGDKFISLGESLDSIKTRFKHVYKENDDFHVVSDSSGGQFGNFYRVLTDSTNYIEEIHYFCTEFDNPDIALGGRFFDQKELRRDGLSPNEIYDYNKKGVGCGQSIANIKDELNNPSVYCDGTGDMLFSAQGFKQYSSNKDNYYEFFTRNDKVIVVVLTRHKGVPENFKECN